MEIKGESSGLDFSNFIKYIHYSEQKIDILSSEPVKYDKTDHFATEKRAE